MVLAPLKTAYDEADIMPAMGYIPTRRGHAEGGYEAGYRSARYEPETGHQWAATPAELLREMK
jgi:hypothetical protein